jgi:hypothetical protein
MPRVLARALTGAMQERCSLLISKRYGMKLAIFASGNEREPAELRPGSWRALVSKSPGPATRSRRLRSHRPRNAAAKSMMAVTGSSTVAIKMLTVGGYCFMG